MNTSNLTWKIILFVWLNATLSLNNFFSRADSLSLRYVIIAQVAKKLSSFVALQGLLQFSQKSVSRPKSLTEVRYTYSEQSTVYL